MIGDAWTVAWREWRHYLTQIDDRQKTGRNMIVMLIAIIVAERLLSISEVFESLHPSVLIWIWTWLPLGSAIALGVDAFAGERERHTLETLLATRLSEGSILLGKLVAAVSYAWLSSLGFAFGVMVVISLAGLPGNDPFLYPWEVLLIAPITSLLTATSGASAAVLISLRAPTVRHANMRILMLASILPLVLIFALTLIVATVIAGFTILGAATGSASPGFPEIDRRTAVTVGSVAGVGLYIVTNIAIWVLARVRFKRWAMIDLEPPPAREDTDPRERPEDQNVELEPSAPTGVLAALPMGSADHVYNGFHQESRLQTVLRDARVVTWKEWREFVAMYREWRGWFWVAAVILGWMAFQMSASGSRYWAESSAFSLVWWLAMAGAIPLLVSQRIADSIAGERERHTGEVLFTTRLSSLGILLGKLAGATLAPWTVALGIPLVGLLTVNLVQNGGPFGYPAGVLVAGVAFSAAGALLMACLGVLVSMRAATVQDAARRMSWLVLPYGLIPAFGFRRMVANSDEGDTFADSLMSQPPDALMTGELTTPIQIASVVMFLLCALLLTIIIRQFRRGTLDFGS